MDEATYKARLKRLQQVNKDIEKLDPAIREHAFKILQPYVTGREGKAVEHKDAGDQDTIPTEDAEAFFSRFDHEKPSDNALLVAAYHFGQYGSEAFSMEEVKQLATDVGITIPERVDMTFLQARHEGKKLFKRAGRGKFSPTVHGEAHLKKEYKLQKGRKKKPKEVDE